MQPFQLSSQSLLLKFSDLHTRTHRINTSPAKIAKLILAFAARGIYEMSSNLLSPTAFYCRSFLQCDIFCNYATLCFHRVVGIFSPLTSCHLFIYQQIP